MSKRKEYMKTAEMAVRELAIAYYYEHGKFPDRYSVLKSALTRSYKNMLSEVSDIIYKHKEQTGQSLDYDETFKQVLGIKEYYV